MHDDDGWNGNDGYDLLVLFLFILAAVYGVKWVWGQRPSSTSAHGESALDLLKKRYAKGEISREEFERIRRKSNTF